VLAEAEAISHELEHALDQSRLPDHPDFRRIDRLQKRVGDELARRHVTGVPGPFGKDAPAAPVPNEVSDG
jgi:hypothetical protein